MRHRLPRINGRREAIYVALAAAEVCWAVPAFLALSRTTDLHMPLPIWLGLLVLLLGYSYYYRALAEANLGLRLQQGLLIGALLLSIWLILRFHIYTGVGLGGVDWLLQPLQDLVDLKTAVPRGWIALMTLVYLWTRGIQLARRSLSADSVGFSFRAGIVIFLVVSLTAGLYTGGDVSGFVVPYFFFALTAVGLARIEEVSHAPNSSRAGFSGFWIGSTVGAVGVLVLLGMVVAVLFCGGGLSQIVDWLSPVLVIIWGILVGFGVLLLVVLEELLSLLSVDMVGFGEVLADVLRRLGELLMPLPTVPSAGGESQTALTLMALLQKVITIAIPATIIALVVLFTWHRVRRGRGAEGEESRESMLSGEMLARSLHGMLQTGRDRLTELAGLINRFGLGSRFLSAVSIRRIYTNLVRLASEAGYPRAQTQTPYEYLETLHEALPGSETDAAVITEAYVSARYGQVPDTREELQRIRDCWERVRLRQAQL